MAKSGKNNKGDKKKLLNEAIESDPRFAGIKKDPVLDSWLESCDQRFKPVKKEKTSGVVDERFKKNFATDRKPKKGMGYCLVCNSLEKKEEKVEEQPEEEDLLAQLEELNVTLLQIG